MSVDRVPFPPRPALPREKRDENRYVVSVYARIPLPATLSVSGSLNQAPWVPVSLTSQDPVVIGLHGSAVNVRTSVIGHYAGMFPDGNKVHRVVTAASSALTPRSNEYASASGFSLTGGVSAPDGSGYTEWSSVFPASHVFSTYNASMAHRWFDILAPGRWTFDIDATTYKAPLLSDAGTYSLIPWACGAAAFFTSFKLVMALIARRADGSVSSILRSIGESVMTREEHSTYNLCTPHAGVDGVFMVDVPGDAFDAIPGVSPLLGIRLLPLLVEGGDGTLPRDATHNSGLMDRIYYFARMFVSATFEAASTFDLAGNDIGWTFPASVSGVPYA